MITRFFDSDFWDMAKWVAGVMVSAMFAAAALMLIGSIVLALIFSALNGGKPFSEINQERIARCLENGNAKVVLDADLRMKECHVGSPQ